MFYRRSGLTLTQSWTTANSLDTKIELENKLAKGVKAEVLTNYLPATQAYGAKTNLYFKQPNIHGRVFLDLLKGPVATVDATVGHEGFLVGAEAGYNVQAASITRYSAAVGYQQPLYAAAITATNNLSVFAASYYHKVNSEVEAGAKATWDSKAGNNVGLEVATKYRLDPMSFAKVSPSGQIAQQKSYNCTGQGQRPRYRLPGLQRSPPTRLPTGSRCLFRHEQAQRGFAQGRMTLNICNVLYSACSRSAPTSNSPVKRHVDRKECMHNGEDGVSVARRTIDLRTPTSLVEFVLAKL